MGKEPIAYRFAVAARGSLSRIEDRNFGHRKDRRNNRRIGGGSVLAAPLDETGDGLRIDPCKHGPCRPLALKRRRKRLQRRRFRQEDRADHFEQRGCPSVPIAFFRGQPNLQPKDPRQRFLTRTRALGHLVGFHVGLERAKSLPRLRQRSPALRGQGAVRPLPQLFFDIRHLLLKLFHKFDELRH
jgi:hypothetical protein